MSRIYLALQLAVRASGPADRSTLVFDEVDAGIGGAQAEALGGKLARLAAGGQILVVTHLPQVASHAHLHFRVEKRVMQERTQTRVLCLDPEQRVDEVARMLGGRQVTELSRSHAAEMIATWGKVWGGGRNMALYCPLPRSVTFWMVPTEVVTAGSASSTGRPCSSVMLMTMEAPLSRPRTSWFGVGVRVTSALFWGRASKEVFLVTDFLPTLALRVTWTLTGAAIRPRV